MKFLSTIWRILAIAATVGLIVMAVMFFAGGGVILDPKSGAIDTQFLIIYICGYVLSLSSAFRAVYTRTEALGPFVKALIFLPTLAACAILMPVLLVWSIVGRAIRIFRDPERELLNEQLLAEAAAADIRSSVWEISAGRAVDFILDPAYRGPVRVDDGDKVHIMKQVALIRLDGNKYVLLSPTPAPDDEGEIPDEGTAIPFAIAPKREGEGYTLVRVQNENLSARIYSVYNSLVAERDIFG